MKTNLLIFIAVILITTISCKINPPNTKEKLKMSFNNYIDSIPISQMDLFSKYQEEYGGLEHIFGQLDKEFIFAVPKPEPTPPPEVEKKKKYAELKLNSMRIRTKSVVIDFDEINNARTSLINSHNEFRDPTKKWELNLSYTFIHTDSLAEVMARDFANNYPQDTILNKYRTQDRLSLDTFELGQEVFLNRMTLLTEIVYDSSLVANYKFNDNVTKEIIPAAFNLGKICPPNCPDDPPE